MRGRKERPAAMKKIVLSLIFSFVCLIPPAFGAAVISDGVYVIYRSQGLHLIENYQDLERNGGLLQFFENGDVNKSFQYKHNELHGTVVRYYPNRSVYYRLQFYYGTLNGPAQRYYSNGQLAVDMRYRFGAPDGVVRFYTERGTLEKVALYDRGRLVRVRLCDAQGNLAAPITK